jgi:putative transposase
MAQPTTLGGTGLTEQERAVALARFHTIRPYLEEGVPLANIAQGKDLHVSTLYRWANNYQQCGLAGLSRHPRTDKSKRRMSSTLQQFIEGLALQQPPLTAAAVHRQTAAVAAQLHEPVPSYRTVHMVVQGINPALITLAQEGAKAYGDRFDLIHRREAERPNAIWQADHCKLDILVEDDDGNPQKPWLTIILDDYSRAVAGYMLSFTDPSAIQTALALRQAIWRKPRPGWHVCGIPQILYIDHGSDFTSRHIEQVAADLKIRLVFSTVGKPRGRGKIERFFKTVQQVLLMRLPCYAPGAPSPAAVLTLDGLATELERFLLEEYHVTPHSTTGVAPQARWDAGGFLPQMPESLERLDLLLLTVPATRKVRPEGISFQSFHYIDPTLAAYVGEEVMLRYDPRDMAEIRVFHRNRFLCRAICQELAGETVSFREIANARARHRRELRQTIQDRRRLVDSLLEAKRRTPARQEPTPPAPEPAPAAPKLKRYFNE